MQAHDGTRQAIANEQADMLNTATRCTDGSGSPCRVVIHLLSAAISHVHHSCEGRMTRLSLIVHHLRNRFFNMA